MREAGVMGEAQAHAFGPRAAANRLRSIREHPGAEPHPSRTASGDPDEQPMRKASRSRMIVTR